MLRRSTREARSYRHRLPPGGRPLRYENHDVTAGVSRRFDGRPTESRRYEQGQPGLSIRWNPDVHPVVRLSLVAQHVGPAGFSDLEARRELFKATQIRPTSGAVEETIANVSRVRPA